MPDLPEMFDRTVRCMLAFSGRRSPVIAPMAFWCDGSGLWMSTPAVSVKARALRKRPRVAVYVPPVGGVGDGAVATGSARVYGLHDPLGLAVHGPVVSAAMAALAARNAGTILGYVQDAHMVPARFRPRNRVALRVLIDDVTTVPAPQPGEGIAPALPTVVSPDVRRALSGRRVVTLATADADGTVSITPAVWGAGLTLQPSGQLPPAGTPAAVHVGTDPQNRPTAVIGLSLTGAIAGDRLQPRRATWWEGFALTTVDLPAAPPSITLPD